MGIIYVSRTKKEFVNWLQFDISEILLKENTSKTDLYLNATQYTWDVIWVKDSEWLFDGLCR